MKTFFIRYIFFVLLNAIVIFYFVSCSKGDKKKAELLDSVTVKPVKAGQIEFSRCIKDTFFSYFSYTPEKYSAESSWPVIFIFDPHARGSLPVRKYRKLADEYGYILIAANDSRNGQSYEFSRRVFESLRNDSRRRWHIDDRREYLLGFSGGARLASLLMREFPDLQGMVGCGAGFAYAPPESLAFVFAGLAGTTDFNLAEMRQLHESLDAVSAEHVMIEFDGKHEWPPSTAMRTAWDWMEVSAMRKNMIPAAETRLTSILNDHTRLIRDARSRYQTGEIVQIYRRLVRMLNHLYDVREYQEALADMERLYVVHDFFKLRRQLRQEEIKRQRIYAESITKENLKWWKNEIKKLKLPTKEKPPEEYRMMNLRLLQYMGLLAYMSANRAIQEKNAEMAETFLSIGRLADPGNPGLLFLQACYWMINDKPKTALVSLDEAARLGFADLSAMEDESLLTPIKSDSAYAVIFRQVQANADKIDE